MGFYVKTSTFLDEFTESGFLRKRWGPRFDKSLEEAEAFRKRAEILSIITNLGRITGGSGEIKHVASIDPQLGLTMLGLEPDIFEKAPKFYRWLERHPEWKTA